MKRKLTAGRRAKRAHPASRGPTNRIGRFTNAVGGNGWGQLFVSDTLVALLRVFLLNPENAFYQRELADAAGTGLYAVQQELARLERVGLVVKAPRGNRAYYRADRSHPAFEDLKRVVIKTVGLGDALRTALAQVKDRVRVAFVYGSYAKGQETAGSDIDLILIGSLTSKEAAAFLGSVARELGRQFNVVVYSPQEFAKKSRDGHHFIMEVQKAPKVFLIGSQHELANVAS
ncbi:MAG: nucleotidyltransferase domain-containing protein [Candidatus Methylomirabilaceae bacterium]